MSLFKARKVGGLPPEQIGEGADTSEMVKRGSGVVGTPWRLFAHEIPRNTAKVTSGSGNITTGSYGAEVSVGTTSGDHAKIDTGNRRIRNFQKATIEIIYNTWDAGAPPYSDDLEIGAVNQPNDNDGYYIDLTTLDYHQAGQSKSMGVYPTGGYQRCYVRIEIDRVKNETTFHHAAGNDGSETVTLSGATDDIRPYALSLVSNGNGDADGIVLSGIRRSIRSPVV